MFDKIALILTVIGGINWGLIGFFQFDLVAFICGGSTEAWSAVSSTRWWVWPLCGASPCSSGTKTRCGRRQHTDEKRLHG